MAQMNFAIKDRQTAKAWLARVEEINEDYYRAMTEATEALKDANAFDEGTFMDELVNCADLMLNAAQETYQAIGAIAETVTTILNTVGEVVDRVKEEIGNVINNLFG
ncbi:MAG: hypothetical protein E7450_06765 [Ruminococcaceae bacterium]|nr:hypothetical protein [Oscillospiraceae bacterium]